MKRRKNTHTHTRARNDVEAHPRSQFITIWNLIMKPVQFTIVIFHLSMGIMIFISRNIERMKFKWIKNLLFVANNPCFLQKTTIFTWECIIRQCHVNSQENAHKFSTASAWNIHESNPIFKMKTLPSRDIFNVMRRLLTLVFLSSTHKNNGFIIFREIELVFCDYGYTFQLYSQRYNWH